MEALRDTQKIISPILQRADSFRPGKFVEMPGGYKVFHPSPIHCHWKWDDPETLELCDLAHEEITRMNGLTQGLSFLPQVHKMHLFYEATLSCRLSSIVPWEFSLRDAACQAEYVPYENVKPWRIINDNYTRASAKVVNLATNLAALLLSLQPTNSPPQPFSMIGWYCVPIQKAFMA